MQLAATVRHAGRGPGSDHRCAARWLARCREYNAIAWTEAPKPCVRCSASAIAGRSAHCSAFWKHASVIGRGQPWPGLVRAAASMAFPDRPRAAFSNDRPGVGCWSGRCGHADNQPWLGRHVRRSDLDADVLADLSRWNALAALWPIASMAGKAACQCCACWRRASAIANCSMPSSFMRSHPRFMVSKCGGAPSSEAATSKLSPATCTRSGRTTRA